MKQKSWCLRGFVLGVVLAAACGSAEVDPLDPSTFAGMNADKIQYDCRQTVQCQVQRGETLMADPFGSCEKATARHLQAHADQQMQYLINVNRCAGLVVCDYLTCVQADVTNSYGRLQMDKVTYNCQQDVECRRQLGMLVGEVTMELDSCIANNIGVLDSFNPMQRMQYEAEFMRCGQQVACDFANCFPF